MLAAKGRLRLAPVPAYGRPCLPLRAMVRLSYRDGEHQTARALARVRFGLRPASRLTHYIIFDIIGHDMDGGIPR